MSYTVRVSQAAFGSIELICEARSPRTALFMALHQALPDDPLINAYLPRYALTIEISGESGRSIPAGAGEDPAFSLTSEGPPDVERPLPNKTGRSE